MGTPSWGLPLCAASPTAAKKLIFSVANEQKPAEFWPEQKNFFCPPGEIFLPPPLPLPRAQKLLPPLAADPTPTYVDGIVVMETWYGMMYLYYTRRYACKGNECLSNRKNRELNAKAIFTANGNGTFIVSQFRRSHTRAYACGGKMKSIVY